MKIEVNLTDAAVAAIERYLAVNHPYALDGEPIECVECLVRDWMNRGLRVVLPHYDGSDRPNPEAAARMAREGAQAAMEKWDAANLALVECAKEKAEKP